MEINIFIKSLDWRELRVLRNYIDYRLTDYENKGFGEMTLEDFEQKLRNENVASIRLIYVINTLRNKVEFVHQITKDLVVMQKNTGIKTWKEFVKMRGY